MKLKLSTVGLLVLATALIFAALLAHLNLRRDAAEVTFEQGPLDHTWPVTPVVVGYSADVALAHEAQVKKAVSRINDEVGCTVLDTSGAPVSVRIITPIDDSPCANAGSALNPGDDGATTHVCQRRRDGTFTADIVLERGGWDIRQAYLIIKHELLHALALAHDQAGILAPRHPEWDWAAIDVPGEMLSAADRRALKQRYCNRGGPDAK